MGLDGARGSEFPEGAFGDPGEDARHGVNSVLGVHVGEVDDLSAIGHEGAVQEEVGEVDVADDHHQAQRLAQEEPYSPVHVHVEVLDHVLRQDLVLLVPLAVIKREFVEASKDGGEEPAFHVFPKVPRDVKHDRLEY